MASHNLTASMHPCALMLFFHHFKLERQIQMQNIMRERMMATQIARAREMFNWVAGGYGAICLACFGG